MPDVPVDPGLALLVDCNAGGRATLVLDDSSTLSLTFSPGLTLLPLAVIAIQSAGQTAALDAWVLD
ncbi:hypothetical protein ELI_12230 [Erythrobacter litoralis HTCC2594]|uniref:Uncharacterized protein n=1 Tax=Erythrobacter litoralis (strain HTCC2594) TaxID=314225 RepID=Q2N703_ERYLH|nr:hypothetical protein ELI_12230 [Erythrobacter litoralis HTCC2594]